MSSSKSSLVPLVPAAPAAGAISVRETVLFALRFFMRQWHCLIAAAWLPMLLAALILYISLDGYLAGLERYQGAPNSRTAGLALAQLAAGIFASLFLYSMVMVSIVDMLNGRGLRWPWVHFRTQGQEWRLFAAHLKFSVGVVAIFAVLGGSAVFDVMLIPLWLFMPLGIVVAYALYVRTAFLFPPLIMSGRGPVVRRAWQFSASNVWRIVLIVLLLSLPGIAAELVSEVILGLAGVGPGLSQVVSPADYAIGMRQALWGFLAVITVWTFFNLSLLTAGAVFVHRALSREREDIIR